MVLFESTEFFDFVLSKSLEKRGEGEEGKRGEEGNFSREIESSFLSLSFSLSALTFPPIFSLSFSLLTTFSEGKRLEKEEREGEEREGEEREGEEREELVSLERGRS